MNAHPRTLALAFAAVFLLVLLSMGGRPDRVQPDRLPDENPRAARQVSPELADNSPTHAEETAVDNGTATNFSPEMAALVAALEQGAPLAVRVGGRQVEHFVTREYPVVASGFQVSLGARQGTGVPTDQRTFQGRGAAGSRLVLSVVNGAMAAMVTSPRGSVLQVKSDPASGKLLALEIEEPFHACALGEGGDVFEMDGPTYGDDAWRDGPDVEIDAVAGDDPATGQLTKTEDIIPWGPRYDLSLADAMLLMVLDKEATGSDSSANIESKTAQYLAIATNAATIYEYQLGIRLRVQELVMIPNTGSYSEITPAVSSGSPKAEASLTSFGTWLGTNRNIGTYDWTVAALWDDFAGSNSSSNTVGLAAVGAAGTSSGSSTNDVGTSWSVVTHEIGHNFGARHTGGASGVMAGILSGSNTQTRSFYVQEAVSGAVGAKAIYDDSRSVLFGPAPLRDPLQIPYANDDDTTTPAGTPVTISPLANDALAAPTGSSNSALSLVEASAVSPPGAGTVELSGSDLTFTPAPGFEGTAWFSYTVGGDLGNGGDGWLHKADIAVVVGGGQSAPAPALPDAIDDAIAAFDPELGVFRFNPLVNDLGDGYRHAGDVVTKLGPGGTTTAAVPGNAFYITGATNLDPAKGTLTFETLPVTIAGVATDVVTGFMQFTPAAGASGIARVEYTVTDSSGGTDTALASIALDAVTITSPLGSNRVLPGHGVAVSGATPILPLPFSPVTSVNWSAPGAPAAVTFTDPSALHTTATFAAPGIYKLKLTGTGDGIAASAETTVFVSATAVSTDGLEGLWELDESSGTSAPDTSGGNADATLVNGPSWQAAGGTFDGALGFDGSNDYVTVPAITGYNDGKSGGTLDDYAVSLWFRPTDLPASGSIQMLWDAGDEIIGHNLYLLGNEIVGGNWDRRSVNIWTFLSGGTVQENVWHHVAFVVSGGDSMQLFLDGILVASGEGYTFPDSAARNGFGAYVDGSLFDSDLSNTSVSLNTGTGSLRFEGSIDRVAIFSRALGDQEVRFLAESGVNLAPSITFSADPLAVADTSQVATLGATVGDSDPVTTRWELVSGPGTAFIPDPTAVPASALFTGDGSYEIDLLASDHQIETFRTLTVNVAAQAEPFSDFLDGFPSLTGPDRDPGADPEGDDLDNLGEFAFVGNPATGVDSAKQPGSTIITDGGDEFLEVTYRRRTGGIGTTGADYTVDGIRYTVETADDLVAATWAPAPVEQVGPAAANGDGTETVTVRFLEPLDTTLRNFVRVAVRTFE